MSNLRRFAMHPPGLDGLPRHVAPEMAAALTGVSAERLAVLADSLAVATQRSLARGDLREMSRRLFGDPAIDRQSWADARWRAVLASLLTASACAPATLPAASVDLPGRPDLGSELDAHLDRWLTALRGRLVEFPLEHQVYFPTGAGTLVLGAWGSRTSDLPFLDGYFHLLTPGVALVGDSWMLAAAIGRALVREGLSGGPRIIASGGVQLDSDERDGRVLGVEWPDEKLEAVRRWREWHSSEFVVCVPRTDLENVPLDHVTFVDTVSEAVGPLRVDTRYRGLRPSPARTSLGARLINDDQRDDLALDPPLPCTRLRHGTLDLDDWIRRGATVVGPRTVPRERIVYVTGAGGIGKSRALLQIYARHGHVGLVDMRACPDTGIAAWVRSSLGGDTAFEALIATEQAVVIVEGIDDGPEAEVRRRLQEVNRSLSGLRRVFVAQSAQILEQRVGGGPRVPEFKAVVVATRLDLETRGVPPWMIAWLVDADDQVSSMALAELVLESGAREPSLSEGRLPDASTPRAYGMLTWVGDVERAHNRSHDVGQLEDAARRCLDAGEMRLQASAELRGSPFLHKHGAWYAFRHSTHAVLFGARWLLRTADMLGRIHSSGWRAALAHVAEELALNAGDHAAWSMDMQAWLFAWMGRLAVDARKPWEPWVRLARERSDAAAQAVAVVEGRGLWQAGDPRGLPLLRRAAEGEDEHWTADARVGVGRALTEQGALGSALAYLGPALGHFGNDLGQVLDRVPKRSFSPSELRDLRPALHALGAMARALCWFGSLESACRLLDLQSYAFERFREDGTRARLRQAHVLVSMKQVARARALRDGVLHIPTRADRACLAALDLRLGIATDFADPEFGALLAWARWDGGDGDPAEAIRLYDEQGRLLEAARVLWQCGRYDDALERVARRVAQTAELAAAYDPGAIAPWAAAADPRLATLAGRLEILHARAGDPDAATFLPPW